MSRMTGDNARRGALLLGGALAALCCATGAQAQESDTASDEIVVTKTTDSALTGTNLRLILSNLGIRTVICVGIFTDQCIASTVRSLADESFDVVVLDDCCAAATDALHRRELEIINMIYCNVMTLSDLKALMRL